MLWCQMTQVEPFKQVEISSANMKGVQTSGAWTGCIDQRVVHDTHRLLYLCVEFNPRDLR